MIRPHLLTSSLIKQKIDSMAPNSVSIPKKTIERKKKKIEKLGKGRIASALGKMLKLKDGPAKSICLTGIPCIFEK